MRKGLFGALAAGALLATGLTFAPSVSGQVRRDREVRPAPERRMFMLDGRGSQIGVSVRDLQKEDAERAKLQAGVVVEDVDEDSPAAKAGIREGDVIVEFDGERVRSARHLTRLVQETAEGRTVKGVVVRDGNRQTLDITPEAGAPGDVVMRHMPRIEREVERSLRAMPREFAFNFDFDDEHGGPGVHMSISPRGRLGVQLSPLSEQLAGYFGVKDGALVSSVERDSPAEKAGLKAGDVITKVNGRTVDGPADISRELRDADGGETVELGIVRDKKETTLKATVPERDRPARRRVRPAVDA